MNEIEELISILKKEECTIDGVFVRDAFTPESVEKFLIQLAKSKYRNARDKFPKKRKVKVISAMGIGGGEIEDRAVDYIHYYPPNSIGSFIEELRRSEGDTP